MTALKAYVPREPLALDDVVQRLPAIRQSTLSSFDDCALSAFFDLAHGQGWSTHPQARGTIMHRAIAECLRTMKGPPGSTGEDTIPVSEALEILHETLRQEKMYDPEAGEKVPVPVEEIVRVPLRQVSELRRFISKFAADNSFDVASIVDIEKPLEATAVYAHPETGEVMERVLRGTLDCLMFKPPAGALVIDWKDTWGLPPDHSEQAQRGEEDDGSGLSWHGYFQQRFYAWLVMKNYSRIESVTLREFYIRHTEPRPATVHRKRLHLIEQEMALLAHDFDLAVAQGAPRWPYKLMATIAPGAPEELRGAYEAGTITVEDLPQEYVHPSVGRWKPSPGKHCGFCLRPGACPIEDSARGEGAIKSKAMAERYAAEMEVIDAVRNHRLKALKVWCEAHGDVFVKWAKGRMFAGWRANKTGGGRRFGVFPAAASDRSSKQERAVDAKLVEAARASAARARAARGKR